MTMLPCRSASGSNDRTLFPPNPAMQYPSAGEIRRHRLIALGVLREGLQQAERMPRSVQEREGIGVIANGMKAAYIALAESSHE